MSEIAITWEADDGYVGGDRPQEATINASDFVGLDRTDVEGLFNLFMDETLRMSVSWYVRNYDAVIQEIMDAAAKLGEGGE